MTAVLTSASCTFVLHGVVPERLHKVPVQEVRQQVIVFMAFALIRLQKSFLRAIISGRRAFAPVSSVRQSSLLISKPSSSSSKLVSVCLPPERLRPRSRVLVRLSSASSSSGEREQQVVVLLLLRLCPCGRACRPCHRTACPRIASRNSASRMENSTFSSSVSASVAGFRIRRPPRSRQTPVRRSARESTRRQPHSTKPRPSSRPSENHS